MDKMPLLRTSFASVLQCDAPRYWLGAIAILPCLSDMPAMFGSNQALDLFANAVISSHAGYVNSRPSTEAMRYFTRGLGTLGSSFGDRGKVSSIATLAAIYMMLVAQVE